MRLSRLVPSLVLAAASLAAFTPVHAAKRYFCPTGFFCQTVLGVAVRPPAGDRPGMSSINVPTHLAVISAKSGPGNYHLRLDIGPWGKVGRHQSAERAAYWGMRRLLAHERVKRSLRHVTFNRAVGYLALHVPSPAGSSTSLVLAYQGRVYKVVAPGKRLAPDQLAMLRSIKFLPLPGAFPKANG